MNPASFVLLDALALQLTIQGQPVYFIGGPLEYGTTGTNPFLLPLERGVDIEKARLLAAADELPPSSREISPRYSLFRLEATALTGTFSEPVWLLAPLDP